MSHYVTTRCEKHGDEFGEVDVDSDFVPCPHCQDERNALFNALAGIKGTPEDIRAVLMAAKHVNDNCEGAALGTHDDLREALSKIQFPEE